MAASLKITKWNADKILARSAQILEDYGPIIAEETQRQISTQKWTWDRGTTRFVSLLQPGTKRGKGVYIPPGPRDIVDTGELLKSQTAPQVTADGALSVMSIRWTAPYSELVRTGGNFGSYVNVNGVIVTPGNRPGRDWIGAALQARPFKPFFLERWRALSGA